MRTGHTRLDARTDAGTTGAGISSTETDLTNKEAYSEMRALLDDQEYENFAAAAARISKRQVMIID